MRTQRLQPPSGSAGWTLRAVLPDWLRQVTRLCLYTALVDTHEMQALRCPGAWPSAKEAGAGARRGRQAGPRPLTPTALVHWHKHVAIVEAAVVMGGTEQQSATQTHSSRDCEATCGRVVCCSFFF